MSDVTQQVTSDTCQLVKRKMPINHWKIFSSFLYIKLLLKTKNGRLDQKGLLQSHPLCFAKMKNSIIYSKGMRHFGIVVFYSVFKGLHFKRRTTRPVGQNSGSSLNFEIFSGSSNPGSFYIHSIKTRRYNAR